MKKAIVKILLVFCVIALMCSAWMLIANITVADMFNIILWTVSTLGYLFFSVLCLWGLSEIK